MTKLKIAVAGVGNNISALIQGAQFYAELGKQGVPESQFPGVRCPRIGGLGVADLEVVAAYDVNEQKIGLDVNDAILVAPNNYPRLDVTLSPTGVRVVKGVRPDPTSVSSEARPLTDEQPTDDEARVIRSLQASGAEVLLYSLPTGLQAAVESYARCAFYAGVAFVNCTPDVVTGHRAVLAAFEAANVPLLGDDLASHLGSSVIHKTILELLGRRGISLQSSYQINFGGNEDFRNLRDNGASKAKSKKNALHGTQTDRVEVIPSAGYIASLQDTKVAIVNVEGEGWAGTGVSLDLRLRVQDSSNAAGVIIDLVRYAGEARRAGKGGFVEAAAPLLKSPPRFKTNGVDRSQAVETRVQP
ncbi:MAG TPA: hypothetical protein VM686_33645 [Polyangiaceae bacterium]|nr:hypothetical protein [Polyangiaceae bacterium]